MMPIMCSCLEGAGCGTDYFTCVSKVRHSGDAVLLITLVECSQQNWKMLGISWTLC